MKLGRRSCMKANSVAASPASAVLIFPFVAFSVFALPDPLLFSYVRFRVFPTGAFFVVSFLPVRSCVHFSTPSALL
ncbi:hypothetical protein, partial [Salmonella enterica]|uniref:hypothetical protein n=1 Tax=Salmonella enterica TaxID=28901 RepID=UPI00398C8104